MHRPLIYSQIGLNTKMAAISSLMDRALTHKNLLSIAAGFTANDTLPVDIINKVWSSLYMGTKNNLNHEYLQYGTTQGRPELRKIIAHNLQQYKDEDPDNFLPSNIVVTNGSQQALYLTMQVLCNPGDIVLVEDPSYFVFLELLQGLGIHALPIPCHIDGSLDVHALEELFKKIIKDKHQERLKAVYLISYYSNPSSRCMSSAQKGVLGQLLQKFDLNPVVMEDAAYRDLYFQEIHESPSVGSIPTLAPFTKVYYGTFSKSFSTGLKTGFACVMNNHELLQKILSVKAHHDFGSSNFNQAIIERMFLDGFYNDYIAKQRAYYKKKAHIFCEALQKEGLDEIGCKWQEPKGGLFVWFMLPDHINSSVDSVLCNEAIANGVIYVPGNLCFAKEMPNNFMRLSYGTLNEDLLPVAVKRLAKAIHSVV